MLTRIVGHIESCKDGTLIGWAYCPERPGHRLILTVECDGVPVAVGLANLERQDVAAAGHGDGLCGFRIHARVPAGSRLCVRDTVTGEVMFEDAHPTDLVERTGSADIRSDLVQGNVDSVAGPLIRGWCWQPDHPNRYLRVQAVIDGVIVADTMAADMRGDLINAGIGQGDHAFNLRMPYWCLDGREREVSVQVEGLGPLVDAPVPFRCVSADPIALLETATHHILPSDTEAKWAAELLTCFVRQAQLYLPASVAFGCYSDWHAANTAGRQDDIPPAFADTRPGLDAAIQMLRDKNGTQIVAILDDGAILHPGALSRAYQAMLQTQADILYGDAEVPVDGSMIPWFRPGWSYDLCLSQDYTRGLTLIREDVLKPLGPSTSATALRLRALLCATTTTRIHRLPEILCRLTRAPGAELSAQAETAIREHLTARGVPDATVHTINPTEGLRRIIWPVPVTPPHVSLIIPTRDRLSLVRAAVESIESRTHGVPYEMIIIDNQSQEPETLSWLDDGHARGRFRVIRYDAPFNFSDMNNQAVAHTRGSILGFINNDVELISGDWLRTVTALLARPEVGAVGARLRFPNGMIQHGGVIVGTGGLAENAFQTVHVDDKGYFYRTRVAGNYSAVTAACMFCRRSDFMILEGFDAENLPIAFNDVDLCLRLRETGALIVWTPDIDLYHYESVSRGRDSTPERKMRAMKEELYMRQRWSHMAMKDPYYNPNLNLDGVPFTGLAMPPRHNWRAAF